MNEASAKVKSLVDQEATKIISRYKSATRPSDKVKQSAALSLLALISQAPDETAAKKLLDIMKDL